MKAHGRRRRLCGLLIAALVGLSGAFAAPRPAGAGTANVDEVGTSFQPTQVTVVVNDRVVWTNRSSTSHTVTFDGGPDLNPGCNTLAPLAVGCQAPGSTVQRTFTAPGRYSYHCKIHASQGMTGVVVVASATSTITAGPSTTAAVKTSTTTTTVKTTSSSTTSTTRQLSTSSTVVRSSTTTSDTSGTLLQPGAPPPFADNGNSSAAGKPGGPNSGSDTRTVALIVGLLLAVSAGGGYLLWRLRPGRP
jgi:plastocyanin